MKKSSNRSVILALYLTTFLAAIEGTIVSTAMPIITDQLSGSHLYSWVNTLYLLAMVVATPIFGKLSDIYGRKLLISIGIALFIVGSALSGLAWNMESLIWFRALQGFGGASLVTLPMVIIADMYDGTARYKIQGWLSSIWGIAGILGPLAGGLLVDYVSWRSIFYLNVPFACLSLLLIHRSMPLRFVKQRKAIDWLGISTFSVGILLLLYGLNGIVEQEVMTQKLLHSVLLAIGIALLIVFAKVESITKEAFMPLVIFTDKLFRFTILSGFIISLINVAIIFYVPLWMQHVKGFTATASGIVMIPLSIAWPLGSIGAGQCIHRLGLRKIAFLGASLLLIGTICMSTISMHTSPILIMLFTACCGLSFGILLSSLTFLASAVATENVRGAGLSAVQLFRSLGQAVGLVLFGLLLYTGVTSHNYITLLANSLQHIFTAIAALAVLLTLYIAWTMRQVKQLDQYGMAGITKKESRKTIAADQSM